MTTYAEELIQEGERKGHVEGRLEGRVDARSRRPGVAALLGERVARDYAEACRDS